MGARVGPVVDASVCGGTHGACGDGGGTWPVASGAVKRRARPGRRLLGFRLPGAVERGRPEGAHRWS